MNVDMNAASNSRSEQETRRVRKRDPASAAKNRSVTSLVAVVSAGEWLPAEELHRKLSSAFKRAKRVSLDLAGVDYVDGGSLQLLLALHQEAPGIELLNTSPGLCQWLHYAGAASLIEAQDAAAVHAVRER